MSKKKLDTSSIQKELSGVSAYYRASRPQRDEAKKQKRKQTYKSAQKNEQVSKPMSRGLSKKVSQSIKQEDIEVLAFELRKVRKVKVNTEVPEKWKDKLDTLAHQSKVGKYDLLMYIIGLFLEEVKQEDT